MQARLCILDADYILDGINPLVRLWCKDENGRTVLVLDRKFKPYFYLEPKPGLSEKELGELRDRIMKVEIDYCPRCFGLWFDASEVEKVTRNHFLAQYVSSTIKVAKDSDIDCPCCGAGLRLQNINGVDIDTCESCGGTWFDFGEVEKLHKLKREDVQVPLGDGKMRQLQLIEELFAIE